MRTKTGVLTFTDLSQTQKMRRGSELGSFLDEMNVIRPEELLGELTAHFMEGSGNHSRFFMDYRYRDFASVSRVRRMMPVYGAKGLTPGITRQANFVELLLGKEGDLMGTGFNENIFGISYLNGEDTVTMSDQMLELEIGRVGIVRPLKVSPENVDKLSRTLCRLWEAHEKDPRTRFVILTGRAGERSVEIIRQLYMLLPDRLRLQLGFETNVTEADIDRIQSARLPIYVMTAEPGQDLVSRRWAFPVVLCEWARTDQYPCDEGRLALVRKLAEEMNENLAVAFGKAERTVLYQKDADVSSFKYYEAILKKLFAGEAAGPARAEKPEEEKSSANEARPRARDQAAEKSAGDRAAADRPAVVNKVRPSTADRAAEERAADKYAAEAAVPRADRKPEVREDRFRAADRAERKPEAREDRFREADRAEKKPEDREDRFRAADRADRKPEAREDRFREADRAEKKPEAREDRFREADRAERKPEDREDRFREADRADRKPVGSEGRPWFVEQAVKRPVTNEDKPWFVQQAAERAAADDAQPKGARQAAGQPARNKENMADRAEDKAFSSAASGRQDGEAGGAWTEDGVFSSAVSGRRDGEARAVRTEDGAFSSAASGRRDGEARAARSEEKAGGKEGPELMPWFEAHISAAEGARAESRKKQAGDARPAGGSLRWSADSARPAGDSARRSAGDARPVGDTVRRSADSARPAGDSARRSAGDARPAGDSVRRPAGDARPAGDSARRSAGDARSAGDSVRRPADSAGLLTDITGPAAGSAGLMTDLTGPNADSAGLMKDPAGQEKEVVESAAGSKRGERRKVSALRWTNPSSEAETIRQLRQQNKELTAENTKLFNENIGLKSQISAMTGEEQKLKANNKALENDKDSLGRSRNAAEREIQELTKMNRKLRRENEELIRANMALGEKIRRLERGEAGRRPLAEGDSENGGTEMDQTVKAAGAGEGEGSAENLPGRPSYEHLERRTRQLYRKNKTLRKRVLLFGATALFLFLLLVIALISFLMSLNKGKQDTAGTSPVAAETQTGAGTALSGADLAEENGEAALTPDGETPAEGSESQPSPTAAQPAMSGLFGSIDDFTAIQGSDPGYSITWEETTDRLGEPAGYQVHYHIRFAEDTSGTGLSEDASLPFIGVYVNSKPTDTDEARYYQWQSVSSLDPAVGIRADWIDGPGIDYYLHIAYAADLNGTDFSTTEPIDQGCVGYYISGHADGGISPDSDDYTDYTWTFRG